ncbi:MAG: helix-hairpin-helix domain-containing protein [Bacteroidales bacterium]|nr:helix-hairpin-helix domain-containing protein [Bacteroidales bacterium]
MRAETTFPNIEIIEQAVSEIKQNTESNSSYKKYPSESERKKTIKAPVEYFTFDPNKASARQWKQLGLSEKQAEVVLRYVASGGKFRKAEDLKKIYVISPAKYEELLPYVSIDDSQFEVPKEMVNVTTKKISNSEFSSNNIESKAFVILEINQLDSVEIQQIPGIGPAFGKRIIRYREQLGGFYDIAQLLEVWNMDTIRYNEVKDHFYINDSLIQKLNINSATFKELVRHPYLEYEQVKVLVNVRRKQGGFDDSTAFIQTEGLSEQLLRKLLPYMSFE